MLDIESTLRHIKDDRRNHPSAKKPKHFFKLQLTETDDICLYECASLTVPKGTEEAEAVEKYNADYEFITKGAGKNRRTAEAEVQTENLLVKSRSANTDRIKKQEQGSFVSTYEMHDTYADLARKTKSLDLGDGQRKIEVTTYVREGMENIDEILSGSENFHLSSMILQRLLAANVYRERQKRFRNMTLPDPLDLNVKYLYRLVTLWNYRSSETNGKDVVDMSWCRENGDLLAIAYGSYNYRDSHNRKPGSVMIWSIKNPVNPERRFRYKIPVTAVEFSHMNPQLLAVALYDGTIEVIDITENKTNDDGFSVVARSERKSSPGFEPIWEIQWIQMKDVEYILTASQDGRIMKFKISSGPYLVGYPQLRLDRVIGTVEALQVEHKKTFIEADRHPQVLCLQKHPVNPDLYLVGSDEGCIHTCSTNFPHQHIGVLQVHNGGVYTIDFSPFSPKIFLTAGDWTIRIWIENVFEPIMELTDGFGTIHNAYWSPIHSTIIASCTQDSVQIWDLRRKNQKPASIRTFGKKLTVIKFSPCGRSLIVGDSEGTTWVCGLEDFPFAPHYQYDELQKALYHSLTNKKDLEKRIKQLGYLGYPQTTKS
jgi:dynein intermediate chain 4, axonemal